MKRILRWGLGVVAVLVAAPGLLLWNSIRRAEASVQIEEATLAAEIAAFRARTPALALPQNSLSARRLTFEDGPARQEEKAMGLWNSLKDDFSRETEHFLTQLTWAQSLSLEGGIHGLGVQNALQRHTLARWEPILRTSRPDAAALRRIHTTMAKLAAARQTVLDFVRHESLANRLQLLEALKSRSGSGGSVERAPCWKELYSWRILVAKSIAQEQEDLRYIEENGLPGPGMTKSLLRFRPADRHHAGLFQHDLGVVEKGEEKAQVVWSIARTATALALYQAEQGRDPGSLLDLVPDLLPLLPVHPEDHRPIELRGERLGYWEGPGKEREAWTVLRR